MLDTLLVRCRDGRDGELWGIVPTTQEEYLNATYHFSFRSASITSDDKDKIIRIDSLRMVVTVPTKMGNVGGTPDSRQTVINTNIDVREGQKVVVGKATINGSNDALFLVLTAKVVD